MGPDEVCLPCAPSNQQQPAQNGYRPQLQLQEDVDGVCTDAGSFMLQCDINRPEEAEVVLEDSWEADDVKEECGRRGIRCTELTSEALRAMDTQQFISSTFLCDTAVIHTHLRRAGLHHNVPDTYPDEFKSLYHRTIKTSVLDQIKQSDLPLFVKPRTNDKVFDGMVIRSLDQLPPPEEVSPSTRIYTSEVVGFGAEHRLFVGGGRLYGIGLRLSGQGEDLESSLKAFAEAIVELAGNVFVVVDVGFVESRGGWAVVEANPPFALDDCGLGIRPYMQYCMDACHSFRAKYEVPEEPPPRIINFIR